MMEDFTSAVGDKAQEKAEVDAHKKPGTLNSVESLTHH